MSSTAPIWEKPPLDAERPLLVCGPDIGAAGAEEDVLALAERFALPVAIGGFDYGSFPVQHPNYVGTVETVSEESYDVVCCVGYRQNARGYPSDLRFAAAGFIVPFFFVYSPALLFQGTWIEIGSVLVTGTIGVVALAAGLEGQFLRAATWIERGLFVAAAFLLIDPGFTTDVIGIILLATGLGLQKLRPAAIAVPERVRP
jgi:hypothetical protein